MANIIMVWKTGITHITDDPEGGKVKTRCGRIIANYQYGYHGTENCKGCGSLEDWAAIDTELSAKYRAKEQARQEAHQRAKEEQARRLESHQRLMQQFRNILSESGAIIGDIQELPAGGNFEFEMNGMKFKLSGNIWK